jgi:hypothetical protein
MVLLLLLQLLLTLYGTTASAATTADVMILYGNTVCAATTTPAMIANIITKQKGVCACGCEDHKSSQLARNTNAPPGKI